jgi:hypothetical protein
MADVAFGAWLPDQPKYQGPHLREALGCIPRLKSYGPWPDLAPQSDALAERVRGAIALRDKGGDDAHIYAGTDTKIWELQSGGTWNDVSRLVGGAYASSGEADRWAFAQYGDRAIATNFVDVAQKLDMSTETDFSALSGSPPKAKYAQAFRGFLFLGFTENSGLGVAWSALNNSEGWTPGTDQSDEIEFPDGGVVTGMRATDALYVFQEYAIQRFYPVGLPTVMQRDKITDQSGCSIPGSLCNYERIFFFRSTNGFQMFDGQNITPIGAEQVDTFFSNDADPNFYARMSAAVDPIRKLVVWNYTSVNAENGAPDMQIAYNWVSKTWGHAPIGCELVFPALTTETTLEDGDTLFPGGIDTAEGSFDDPIWAGGVIQFGAFTSLYEFGTFSGSNIEARIEPGVVQVARHRVRIKEARVVVDTTAALLDVRMTESEGDDPAVFGAGESQQSNGAYKLRAAGRFAYFRLTIPAGSDWEHAQAITDIKSGGAGQQ